MSSVLHSELVVVGAGVAGVLVTRELLDAGREVLLLERGGYTTHAEQVRLGRHETSASPTALHSHEPHPETPSDPWEYVYAVGGSGLHWGGLALRFLPSDFELRSRYGVGRDWPLTYAELAPFYAEAEQALGVAGGADAAFGADDGPPLPPHPHSPLDRLVAPHLAPFRPLPQARPTRSIAGRPACCGSGVCRLCPVDAKYTPLHTLEPLLANGDLRLVNECLVVRLRSRPAGDWLLECRTATGGRLAARAKTVVVAANGIENAALLLRSGLGGDDVGRWLYDHTYASFDIDVPDPYDAGVGSTIATGISYAWADGAWRGERGSQLVIPDNLGVLYGRDFVDDVVGGHRGAGLQRRIVDRFRHRIRLDAAGEDVPQAARRVVLSPSRDSLGIPLSRVRYPPDSVYLGRARDVLRRDLEERLRPLRARISRVSSFGGGHQLGTCRMGADDGVVDPQLRLRGREGVYVVGGSAFPTYSAAHPTLTVAALAIRLGRHLAAST